MTYQQLWRTFCERYDLLPWLSSELSQHDRNVYNDFRFSYLQLRSACHLFATACKVRLQEQRLDPALKNWFNAGAAAKKCQGLIESATDVENLAQHFCPHTARRTGWRRSKLLSLTLLFSASLPICYFYQYMLLPIWGWWTSTADNSAYMCNSTATTSTASRTLSFPVKMQSFGLVVLLCVPPLLLFATRFATTEVEKVPKYTAKLLAVLRSLKKLLNQSQPVSEMVLGNMHMLLDKLIDCKPLDRDSKLV